MQTIFHMRLWHLLIISCVLSTPTSTYFAAYAADSLPASTVIASHQIKPFIAQISKQHPRLLLNPERLSAIHEILKTNELAAEELRLIEKRGTLILNEPPVSFIDEDLLEISRTALKRIYILGMLYQLSHKTKWSDRAKKEMLAIAAFPDWHPSHFLDTAEMTHAMAIGYDWCFDQLNEGERKAIIAAIVELGLKRGKDAFGEHKYFWVDEHRSNWNIVCSGGLLIGGLAIANDAPCERELLNSLMPICIDHLNQSIHSFDPDGAWCEGPSYWNYSTIYAATAIDALETSCKSDFELANCEGLSGAGNFFIDLIGPSNLLFNFADASDEVRNSPQLFWLSRRYSKPALAYEERYLLSHSNNKLDPRDLIWFSPAGVESDLTSRPLLNKYMGLTQLACMRTSHCSDALFVGLKGGDNATHHSHLELGTFVFDADGCRWVSAPGMENYDLPGFFDTSRGDKSPRWNYYRTKTEGQNTIMLNGANQDVDARGFLTDFKPTGPDAAVSVGLDLGQAYRSSGITKFDRQFYLLKNSPALLIVDDLAGTLPFEAVWQIHTHSQVEVRGNQAILEIGAKKIMLKVVDPQNASFEVIDVNLQSPQVDTMGLKKVFISSSGKKNSAHFSVAFIPFIDGKVPKSESLRTLLELSGKQNVAR